MLKPGKYQHFKGHYYQVLHIARHSETEAELVIYHPIDKSDDLWVRPLDMFNETITRHGKTMKRFVFVSD